SLAARGPPGDRPSRLPRRAPAGAKLRRRRVQGRGGLPARLTAYIPTTHKGEVCLPTERLSTCSPVQADGTSPHAILASTYSESSLIMPPARRAAQPDYPPLRATFVITGASSPVITTSPDSLPPRPARRSAPRVRTRGVPRSTMCYSESRRLLRGSTSTR